MASAASAASASGIDFDQYPAVAGGTEWATHSFTYGGSAEIVCNLAEFSTGVISGPSETISATLSPGGCSSKSEGKINLQMNGCKFIYHPAVGAGSFDIGPAGCSGITLEGSVCTRVLGPQTGTGASFANEGSGSNATVKITEGGPLQYTISKGNAFNCGSGVKTMELSGSWVLKGFNEASSQIGVHAVPGTGVYLAGEPKFEAEAFPVAITGSQDPSGKLALTIGGNRRIECAEATSHSVLTVASAYLPLGMEYGNCGLTVLGSTVDAVISTNSCNYALHALSGAAPYSATADIGCSKEGDFIQIDVYNGLNVSHSEATRTCSYHLEPQSGLTGVGLSNVGSGSGRAIATSFNLSGLTITRAKGVLGACGGASQKATYTGGSTLYGVS
jgi:hypothetical protein